MSVGMGDTTVTKTADVDFAVAADVVTFTPTKPVDVLRFGLIVTTATATGTDLNLELDWRPTAGSETDRETIASLSPTASVEQGKGLYKDVVADNDPDAGSAPKRVQVDPGEQLVVEVETAGAADSEGVVFIEYVERAFQHTSSDEDEDRLAKMTEA